MQTMERRYGDELQTVKEKGRKRNRVECHMEKR